MKRTLKISALALVIAMLCLSFCGCAALDDRKDTHAVWTQKGSKDSITYNGEVYKLLENEDEHNPAYNEENLLTLYVTEPDVPAILSKRFGIDLQLSSDENFITGVLYDEYNIGYHNDSPIPLTGEYGLYAETGFFTLVFYCKEDMYDEITEKLEAGVNYTGYGYGYWAFEDGNENSYHFFYLSDEDAKFMDKVIDEVKANDSCNLDDSCYSLCTLKSVSEDNCFGGKEYYVNRDDNGNYALSYIIEESGANTIRQIDKKHNKDFERIFKSAVDNVLPDDDQRGYAY